jgi:hypothetical protein
LARRIGNLSLAVQPKNFFNGLDSFSHAAKAQYMLL